MKREDFTLLEVGALEARVQDLVHEYFTLSEAVSSGQETNYAKLGLMKKSIARAKTILKEKQGL